MSKRRHGKGPSPTFLLFCKLVPRCCIDTHRENMDNSANRPGGESLPFLRNGKLPEKEEKHYRETFSSHCTRHLFDEIDRP